MSKLSQGIQMVMKTCSLCKKSSGAEGISLIHFGEWMSKKEITVHYYCLLLSTHLPQNGKDNGGILGFFLRDIRLEITKAKHRQCIYCLDMNATIQCATCRKYFHLTCGHTSKCLSQFVGEFKSYCHACIPVDLYPHELFSNKSQNTTELCYICSQIMGAGSERWIYAKCCGNGFVHSKCMKVYALSAGYYLTCIWCKDRSFREDIKYFGIFVPDREAKWEKEKDAYADLYRRHKRCDMEICNCPRGRDYTNATKWQLITCKLCGAFRAHNPACVPGFESSKDILSEFKCDLCSVTEQTIIHKNILEAAPDLINTSLFVIKDMSECGLVSNKSCENNSVAASSVSEKPNDNTDPKTTTGIQLACGIYTLTESPQFSQEITKPRWDLSKIKQEQDSDEDDVIVDIIVQKVLHALEGCSDC